MPKKKILSLIFILLCLLVCGCRNGDDFYNYPKMYSSYLDKSLGKWEITDVKDEDGYSFEHSIKTRKWKIKSETGIELELHDTTSIFSTHLSREENNVIFADQILSNMNHKYGKNIDSDIKKISSEILDSTFYYNCKVDDSNKNSKNDRKEYAKKVLKSFIIKDMNPKEFYGKWCSGIEVYIEMEDKHFYDNEWIRKEVCTLVNKNYNLNNIKVTVYANKSRKNHTSSYINGEYKEVN